MEPREANTVWRIVRVGAVFVATSIVTEALVVPAGGVADGTVIFDYVVSPTQMTAIR